MKNRFGVSRKLLSLSLEAERVTRGTAEELLDDAQSLLSDFAPTRLRANSLVDQHGPDIRNTAG